jgi:hypothetical protein
VSAIALSAPLPAWAVCQPSTPKTNVATVTPQGHDTKPGRVDLPRVGDKIKITIPRRDETIADLAACFDDTALTPEPDGANQANEKKSGASMVYWVTVPAIGAATSGNVPVGDHALTIEWTSQSGNNKRAEKDRYDFFLKPILESVSVRTISKTSRGNQVELSGDGFDRIDKPKNLIRMNDQPRDVCWAGISGCASTNMIKADVTGRHTIVLDNVDPSEQTARFKVCHGDDGDEHCSNEKNDDSAWTDHAVVLGLSVLVLVVMVAGLVLLIVLGKRWLDIWGERYFTSVLLLDKETDTYSLSKVQFYVWTGVAIFGYAYLVLSRFYVQHWFELPPIPSGLPGIVGIAGGTAVGAQVVTQVNGPKGAGKLRPTLADLVTTGDVVAAERVQHLVWTLIGAGGFFLAVALLDPRTLYELPNVPASILAISGISAFGYLGGKLARDGGPVINETLVTTGPDPDVVPPVTGASANGAPTPTPAWLQSMQTAISAINGAKTRFDGVTSTAGLAGVYTATQTAVGSAAHAMTEAAKLNAASKSADITASKIAVDKDVADSAQGAADAAKAVDAMGTAKAAAADFAAATNIAKIAQDVSKAVQDIQAALLTATPAPATASSSTQFGIIELRGRMLSKDATFKISVGADADLGGHDFQLAFDRLEPSPKDDRHLQSPRVVELDPDANDATLAKRLLLVVKLDDTTKPFFVSKTTHTLTVTNPDSQKVVFRYDVPETQKPS